LAGQPGRVPGAAKRAVIKVAAVTGFFWVIKILTTAMGEAVSDYLVHRYNPYLAVISGFLLFLVALGLQFAARSYRSWTYWLAVSMVAIFGTMAADVLHVEFRVPYAASALLFAVALSVVFGAWYRSEGTLSIKSVTAGRRERFYWAAVLATFAMGTAAGDLAAYTLGLGFLSAGIVFAFLFALPLVAQRLLGLNAIVAFWLAYVMTRPLGASFADWMGKSKHAGGLGWGDGPVAFVLAILIVFMVVFVATTGRDSPQPAPRRYDRREQKAAGLEPTIGSEIAR
jgi:uncharacterized membrane-anchored protein